MAGSSLPLVRSIFASFCGQIGGFHPLASSTAGRLGWGYGAVIGADRGGTDVTVVVFPVGSRAFILWIMKINDLVSAVDSEIARLKQVRSLLAADNTLWIARTAKRHKMSAAGRARIAAAQRKRWAAQAIPAKMLGNGNSYKNNDTCVAAKSRCATVMAYIA